MSYRIQEEDSEPGFSRVDCPSPPPSYNLSNSYALDPPAYCDALQDVVLDSGDNTTVTGGNYH